MNVNYEQISFELENATIDKQELLETIKRIKRYAEYYETLLKYTNKSVKRKKVQEELGWWNQELVRHEGMARKI